MKRTLENLVKKAKDSFSKVGAILGLGASLLSSPSTYDANGEVVFTMEAKNTIDIPKRVSIPYNILKVFVSADNTTETEATSGLEWQIVPPESVKLWGNVIPDPYVNNNQERGETNDFFYPFPMSSSSNHISGYGILDKSYRFTKLQSENPQSASLRTGPKQKKGWAGLYYFDIPKNISIGPKKFKIINTSSYDLNGNIQPSQGTEMTILIIPDYEVLKRAPIILPIDMVNGIPHIGVTDFSKQLCLEASSDFVNWKELIRNKRFIIPNFPNYEYWQSIEFDDKDATNHSKRFYRARTFGQ